MPPLRLVVILVAGASNFVIIYISLNKIKFKLKFKFIKHYNCKKWYDFKQDKPCNIFFFFFFLHHEREIIPCRLAQCFLTDLYSSKVINKTREYKMLSISTRLHTLELNFRVIRVALKGNTVAINLSTAISTRLRMDTTIDTILKTVSILHITEEPGISIRLPLLSARQQGTRARRQFKKTNQIPPC